MDIDVVDKPRSGARLSGFAKIMSANPDIADAYDALFGAVRLNHMLSPGNAVLVTSTEPGEGKTTVCSNLAIAASLAGQTVLLIDGDLRRASLTKAVGGVVAIGLAEFLLGQADPADAIHPVEALAGVPGSGAISFMAGGRKSPISLAAVDWARARTAFRSISQEFDIVFLDSPPVLAANDALLFARLVDAVLLVVGAGTANLDQVRQAREQLDAIGTPIIGAVLNRFEPKVHGRSNQPYRGYYRRSST